METSTLSQDGQEGPFFCASLPAQLVMGAVFGALNIQADQMVNLLHIPLFLDEFFNAAAAFFGWGSCLMSILVHRTLTIIIPAMVNPDKVIFVPADALFAICDIPVAVLVRLMFRKDRQIAAV